MFQFMFSAYCFNPFSFFIFPMTGCSLKRRYWMFQLMIYDRYFGKIKVHLFIKVFVLLRFIHMHIILFINIFFRVASILVMFVELLLFYLMVRRWKPWLTPVWLVNSCTKPWSLRLNSQSSISLVSLMSMTMNIFSSHQTQSSTRWRQMAGRKVGNVRQRLLRSRCTCVSSFMLNTLQLWSKC